MMMYSQSRTGCLMIFWGASPLFGQTHTWTKIHSGFSKFKKSSPSHVFFHNPSKIIKLDDHPIPSPHVAADGIACSPLAKFRPQGIRPRDANLRSAWLEKLSSRGWWESHQWIFVVPIYGGFTYGLIMKHGADLARYPYGENWLVVSTYFKPPQTRQSIGIIIRTRMENKQWLKSPISERVLRFDLGTNLNIF